MPRIPRRSRSAAVATTALLALLALLPSIASAQTVQFGAWTPGDPYYGSVNATNALESEIGRHVDIVHWYQNWGGGSWISAVQPHLLGAVTGSGRTAMLTWEPWAPGAGTDQPAYRLARIAGGDFDAYISTWAVALKAGGSPVYLRPMHEMNADWYPWGGTVNGNSPALYVQAWRRVVDIFRRVGADNVRFVWSPNNVDVPSSNALEGYYPGTSYVDVLAVDGYNWGAGTPAFGGWQSFLQVFGRAYDRLRALGPQPIWIAEVATSADGGDKAAWIRDMFAQARTMDRLQAIVWFNEDKERDWRAAPTPEIAAAFSPAASVDVPAATEPAAPALPPATVDPVATLPAAGATSPPADALVPPTSAPAAATRSAKPMLYLTLNHVRAGRNAVVRWRATRAGTVKRWRTYLDGRLVQNAAVTARRVASRRVARPGRHRWTVAGRDARGRTVVSSTRSFIVRRAAA